MDLVRILGQIESIIIPMRARHQHIPDKISTDNKEIVSTNTTFSIHLRSYLKQGEESGISSAGIDCSRVSNTS
jgi:hypothetical protein